MSERNHSSRARAGLTLLELAVGIAVCSVLMVAIGSVIVVASKAMPTTAASNDASLSTHAALDQMISELRCMTSISESAATAVTFTVPDRDGDKNDETIRYAWSGTPGAPLTRTYKGGSTVSVIPSLQSLSLSFLKHKHTTGSVTTQTWDSGEVQLATFGSWSGIVATSTSLNLTTSSWAAEKFTIDQVSLPADTTRLAITRVTLKLKKPASGSIGATVAVHLPGAAGSNNPSANPVGTPYAVPAAAMSTSFGFVDSTFSDVVFNDASQKDFVIVVKGQYPTTSATLQYLNALLAPLDNGVFRYSTTSGGSWLPSSSLNVNDAPFTVYGSYQRQIQVNNQVDTYTLGSVAISMQTSAMSGTRVDTAVETLNEPSITGP